MSYKYASFDIVHLIPSSPNPSMAALAAEGITIYPEVLPKPALIHEDSFASQKESETAASSVKDLPNLAYTYDPESHPETFNIQDAPEAPVSHRIMVLRQLSCYLSLYISGYK